MRKLLVVSCWLLVCVYSAYSMVDIGDIGVGARPLGMGKATVAGIDDATSIYTNPAALALNTEFNLVSMNGSLMSDVNYFMLGVANTAPIGRVGIGYMSASLAGIPITEIQGTGTQAAVVQTDSTDYSNSIVYFSYASTFARILRGKGEDVSFGLNLKYFLQGFTGGGTAMRQATGVGMDADFGLLWQVRPWSRIGVTFINFIPETFGGRFIWEKNSRTEGIPLTTKIGTVISILGKTALYTNNQNLKVYIDYEHPGETGRPSALWHLGTEYWPTETLALRCGVDQKPKASESGVGVDNNLTAGVGVKYTGFTFDYAFHQFGDLSENTTQFFSIGYRGLGEGVDGFNLWSKKKKSTMPFAEVVPKPDLLMFVDLPEDYWAKKPIEYIATLQIMGGYPDSTFRPNNAISRGELAAVLVKGKDFQVDPGAVSSFADVQDWEVAYVEKAVEREYMKGFANGEFRPNRGLSRAEAAVVFARYAGLYVKDSVTDNVYPDVGRGHVFAPSIAACKLAGFFEYLSGKNFEPNKSLTRGEVAEVLTKVPAVKERIVKMISEGKAKE